MHITMCNIDFIGAALWLPCGVSRWHFVVFVVFVCLFEWIYTFLCFVRSGTKQQLWILHYGGRSGCFGDF